VSGDRAGGARNYSKDDVVICVIDTGIDNEHEDLDQGQVIAWKDFVGGDAAPYDDHGHGTHVAAIAAGQGDGDARYKGVAPGAALIGVKVLNFLGSGSSADIVDGINWCTDKKAQHGIEIITMSLGGGTCTDGSDSMSTAVDNAWDAGLVVTVAAGNSGPDACSVGNPGAAAKAITVGAVGDPDNAACGSHLAGGWYLAPFSSRGFTADGRVKPDIVAPGVCITSADNADTGYVTMSGTSMATPFVAGVVALLLDENPNLRPEQVRYALARTSQDWGPNNKLSEPQSVDYGAGRVQAHDAVEHVCGCGARAGPANPRHFDKQDDLPDRDAYDELRLNVTGTSFPVSITLVIKNASSSKDFDLWLYAPDGDEIGESDGTDRQETISAPVAAHGTGSYKIRVESYRGSGAYWLDVSAQADKLTFLTDP
jgi:serine protease AprX